MFEKIIGQDQVKRYLQNGVEQNQLHHALLFAGDRGVGKSFLAVQLAKVLMGEAKIDSGNHPDLHIIRPTGKGQMIAIDDIRKLCDEVYKPPFEAKQKVFIIEDADRMAAPSANALLKTLEEPTLDSTIIMLSSQPNALLPTILSRSLKLQFFPLSEDQIEAHLKESGFGAEVARMAAISSDGSIGEALKIVQNSDWDQKRSCLIQMLSAGSYLDYMKKAEALSKMIEKEEEQVSASDDLFNQIGMWFRDLKLLQEGGDIELLFFPELEKASSTDIDLELALSCIEEARGANRRYIKLVPCLEYIFLKLLS